MTHLEVVHTADLAPADRAALRPLMDAVFEGDFDDHDLDHALGGLHVLAREAGALAGHAAVVQRQLVHGGRALRAGYVEAVGVRAGLRRRGLGAALMTEVARIVAGAYDLGALGATDQAVPLYARLGWERWRGPTSALTPRGVERTPDADGGVHVLRAAAELDLDGELTCDWRAGELW